MRDAVAKGAKVLVGGRPRAGAGRSYEPTVLVDVHHSMKCMQDETFGPTVPIMMIPNAEGSAARERLRLRAAGKRVDEQREARRRARPPNPRRGGLRQRRAGQLHGAEPADGGWKASGLGTRHGANGIRKYTKVQSLLVTRRALRREPFMFPYKASRTMLLRRMFRLLYERGRRD